MVCTARDRAGSRYKVWGSGTAPLGPYPFLWVPRPSDFLLFVLPPCRCRRTSSGASPASWRRAKPPCGSGSLLWISASARWVRDGHGPCWGKRGSTGSPAPRSCALSLLPSAPVGEMPPLPVRSRPFTLKEALHLPHPTSWAAGLMKQGIAKLFLIKN